MLEKWGDDMEELTNHQLEEKLQKREPLFFVFVHTPLCGTCKLAKRMIEVTALSFPSLSVYSLNINHFPSFAQKWRVESVPSLLIYKNGLGAERIYAFHSISYIHRLFKRYDALQKVQQLKGDLS